MPTHERLMLYCVDAVVVLALVGLKARERLRVSYTFGAYLLIVLALDLPVVFQPARFYHWEYYLAKENVHNIMKFAIVAELTTLAFAGFPRIRRMVRLASFGVLIGVLCVIGGMWHYLNDTLMTALRLQPVILNATALLFAAVAGPVLYYRIPLHPLHKAILFGFMPYLIAFTFALDLLGRVGRHMHMVSAFLSVMGYLILVSYWAWAIWRPRRLPPQEPEVLHRVQPWLPARGGMW